MSTFLLEIVTPERKIYGEEVDMIVVKGEEGELGILPNHIPMVSPLKIGPVRIKKDGSEKLIAVNGGFMEVRKSKVVILAESAEFPSDIDIERARASKERAENRLETIGDYDVKRAQLSLQRALNRLHISSKE